VLRDGSAVTL